MNLSRSLWREAQDTAGRCLRHPFVEGLADGSLPLERYRTFIAQDAFFLDVFARGYAYCAATAPDRHGLETFRRLLNGVFEEIELHASAAAELEIDIEHVKPLPSTLALRASLRSALAPGRAWASRPHAGGA